jgi:hypothetical protein
MRISYNKLKKSIDTINQKLKISNFLNKIEIIERGNTVYNILGNNELCLFSGTKSEVDVFLQGYTTLLDTIVMPEKEEKIKQKEKVIERNLYAKELDNGNLMVSASKKGINTICKNRNDGKIWDILLADSKKFINLTETNGIPKIKKNNTKNSCYVYEDIISANEIDLLSKGDTIIFKKVKI